MACIYIGMSEVSTSEIYVKAGDRVKKGDVWGSFHFGGELELQTSLVMAN